MGVTIYLDTVLVPLSLSLTVGYHAYLWYCFKKKPSRTSIGLDAFKREIWFLNMKEGNDKKGVLAVQSLRNTLMATILSATIANLFITSLAALINNAYNASHIFSSESFGSQPGRIFALKYGPALIFLLISFLCCALAVGFLVDANFLINASSGDQFSPYSLAYTQTIFERGFLLALIGKRVFCITFPLLLWMLGPLPVALSSAGMVCGLYQFDFVWNLTKLDKSNLAST